MATQVPQYFEAFNNLQNELLEVFGDVTKKADPKGPANKFVDPAGKYDPVGMGEAKRLEETISSTTDNFMDQFTFKDRTPAPITTVVQYEDVPVAKLPAYAGTLDYVVKTNFPNIRTASTQEKSFLQSFGIGV